MTSQSAPAQQHFYHAKSIIPQVSNNVAIEYGSQTDLAVMAADAELAVGLLEARGVDLIHPHVPMGSMQATATPPGTWIKSAQQYDMFIPDSKKWHLTLNSDNGTATLYISHPRHCRRSAQEACADMKKIKLNMMEPPAPVAIKPAFTPAAAPAPVQPVLAPVAAAPQETDEQCRRYTGLTKTQLNNLRKLVP